jgi:hypothetical protein
MAAANRKTSRHKRAETSSAPEGTGTPLDRFFGLAASGSSIGT